MSLLKAKIKIINSTEGFEFLGFHLISRQVSDQYKFKIHPSKYSKQRLIAKTRDIIQNNRSASSYNIISLLAPRIISWANYFQFGEYQKDFSKMDYTIFKQIRTWVFRRKSKGLNTRTKIKEKYFPSSKTFVFRGKKYTNNWILVGKARVKDRKKENFLPKLSWIQSCNNAKIRGTAYPYDCNRLYWSVHMAKSVDNPYLKIN